MSDVFDEIREKAGSNEAGIFDTGYSNLSGEIVVWCNTPSLPSLLQHLVKTKRIEIRDYQIITNVDSSHFGIAVKVWICKYGERIRR